MSELSPEATETLREIEVRGFRLWRRLPEFLKLRTNAEYAQERRFAREAARRLVAGAVVIDSGAGEAPYRDLFGHVRYVALDRGIGQADWDYSRLDARADVGRLPLRSASVDAVLSMQVLEHVPEPPSLLRECARVLKPGGTLFLTTPQGWGLHQAPHHFFHFTRFGLRRLLSQAGFDPIEIREKGGYFLYLGKRLTLLPVFLFPPYRSRALRVLTEPLKWAAMVLFCAAAPMVCHYLDRLDRARLYTLGYACTARRGAAVAGT